MKMLHSLLPRVCLVLLLSLLSLSAAEPAKDSAQKIRVLLVTGGHPFEKEPFLQVFKDNPEISFQAVEHPQAQAFFKADAAKSYDVIVLYDYNQQISETVQADFIARLKEGKGLVVLHHAIITYPKWPEYNKIIGGEYYHEKHRVNGVEQPRSIYKHDVDFTIHVADPNHPVTRGVKDFAIHDETYGLFDVAPECHPLLTTEEPTSGKVIGWTKTYQNARVVYLQSGHDHVAYENPNYRQLVRQAIRWTAKCN